MEDEAKRVGRDLSISSLPPWPQPNCYLSPHTPNNHSFKSTPTTSHLLLSSLPYWTQWFSLSMTTCSPNYTIWNIIVILYLISYRYFRTQCVSWRPFNSSWTLLRGTDHLRHCPEKKPLGRPNTLDWRIFSLVCKSKTVTIFHSFSTPACPTCLPHQIPIKQPVHTRKMIILLEQIGADPT